VAQFPLFSIWSTASPATLAYAVALCSLGDGIIAAASCLATATIVRLSDWPRVAPVRGLGFITAIGLAYTVWSEYRNVYVAENWAYASTICVDWCTWNRGRVTHRSPPSAGQLPRCVHARPDRRSIDTYQSRATFVFVVARN